MSEQNPEATEAPPEPTEAAVVEGQPVDGPSVVLTDGDPAAAEAARIEAERVEGVESRRAAHLAGLNTELAFLERQPTPNEARIAAVRAELDTYSNTPLEPQIETTTRGRRGRGTTSES